jgi:hypothetical protein
VLTIRKGMDVYNADQSKYIGTVVRIRRGEQVSGPGAGPVETGSADEARQGNPKLVHEEGATVSPTGYKPEQRLGEEMGPVPTIALGNTGPVKQSAGEHYATTPRDPQREIVAFAVRPGRINLGMLSPSTWVPVEVIRSISMDRIILSVEGDSLEELKAF